MHHSVEPSSPVWQGAEPQEAHLPGDRRLRTLRTPRVHMGGAQGAGPINTLHTCVSPPTRPRPLAWRLEPNSSSLWTSAMEDAWFSSLFFLRLTWGVCRRIHVANLRDINSWMISVLRWRKWSYYCICPCGCRPYDDKYRKQCNVSCSSWSPHKTRWQENRDSLMMKMMIQQLG